MTVEQQIYREILQAVQSMEERTRIHAGRDDDAAKVYEYLLYDRPELFWCDGSSRMTVFEDYTDLYPGYTCTRSEKRTEADRNRSGGGRVSVWNKRRGNGV